MNEDPTFLTKEQEYREARFNASIALAVVGYWATVERIKAQAATLMAELAILDDKGVAMVRYRPDGKYLDEDLDDISESLAALAGGDWDAEEQHVIRRVWELEADND